MRRHILFITALVLAGCATTLETVYVPAENKGWKVGSGVNRATATLVEFIPSDESIANWSRMFTIQFFEGERESPQRVMTSIQALTTAKCPGTMWNVVTADALSVTYEWRVSGCPGQLDQVELARLLRGNDGVHRIAYVRRGAVLDSSERDKWLAAFANAYVEKGGKRVVVAP